MDIFNIMNVFRGIHIDYDCNPLSKWGMGATGAGNYLWWAIQDSNL